LPGFDELRGEAGQLGDAFGEVLPDGETGDAVPRGVDADAGRSGADDENELDLPVNTGGNRSGTAKPDSAACSR
jgi:hypothetical protein